MIDNSVHYKGYSVNVGKGPIILDAETMQPKQTLNLEVYVPSSVEDQASLPDAMIALHESSLVDKIVSDLRIPLLEYVKTVKPFQRTSTPE